MVQTSEDITKKHFNLLLGVVVTLGSVLISTLLFIYFSHITEQKERDLRQEKSQQKIYNELLLIATTNTITIEVIKEYLEKENEVDFDHKINQRYELKHSRPRGGNAKGIFVPDEVYAKRVYK